jgi:hypothetical protein
MLLLIRSVLGAVGYCGCDVARQIVFQEVSGLEAQKADAVRLARDTS